jgi:hypothetical protein
VPFIDAESGTVLNGPIYWVEDDVDLEGLSDSELIDLAYCGEYIAG